jgi:predicted nuclease of restriction endonuclease-like (RecB) superfamily
MTVIVKKTEDALFARIASIIESARGQVNRTINTAMIHAYWLIGQEVIEVEQEGETRAKYGVEILGRLSRRLSKKYGRGYSVPNLRNMRQFYRRFPNGSALLADGENQKRQALPSVSEKPSIHSALPSESVPPLGKMFPANLGWTHYTILMRVDNDHARAFYEIEASHENWSTRELERQIGSLLFERLAKSRDKEQVLALAKEGQLIVEPGDILKDPVILEFLQLEERTHWLERDLEQAIIDRLESFLLEMGKGFCFVARQKRFTLDGDHFYVDLVFYNRLLRAFVLVDLKLGKLTHQDLGQMQMYVNYFDRFQKEEWEAPTVGIVLCSEKNDAMVKITLPQENDQIHAASYKTCLPTEEQLKREVVDQRERIEQKQRLGNKKN